LLLYPDGVSKGFKLVREGKAGVQMKGNEVYKVAVNTLGIWSRRRSTPMGSQGPARLADSPSGEHPHHRGDRQTLDLPMERVIVTINTQGNTSAASVPLALIPGYATAGSSAASFCCWRRSAAASPGDRLSCAIENGDEPHQSR